MRKIFWSLLFCLLAASIYTALSSKNAEAKRPVLSWRTGICPERYTQVELFRKWMIKEGHVDQEGNPLFDIKLEAESVQSSMIQAVSGVGADIIDRVPVASFAPMGVLEDITDFARENGISPEDSYEGARTLFTWNGRQYGYPGNFAVYVLWSNATLFEKLGMEPPPPTWTPEEFERIGKEFTRRANAGKSRQEIFFCAWTPMVYQIARSRGKDIFNETLTAADIANPVFAEALDLHYKWVFEDRLMPSGAERASFNSEGSFGGDGVSLFIQERYGMIMIGRYLFMNLRLANREIRTVNSLFPQYEFQNAFIDGRISAIYAGGKHKKYAQLFLKFLGSKEYNQLLIDGADGLPPNRHIVASSTEYFNPSKFPAEGPANANEFNWANTVALTNPSSPYYPLPIGINNALDKVMNNLSDAEAALKDEEFRINRTIAEIANGNARMKERYHADLTIQKQIDAYRQEGRKIPKSWIKNPFYIAYYRSNGMLDEAQ